MIHLFLYIKRAKKNDNKYLQVWVVDVEYSGG